MKINGQCLCKAITFSAALKDTKIHACHCSMCRRQGGGSASMTLGLQNAATISSGQDVLTTYKSSEWGERQFCSKCGTNLFVNAPSFGYFGVSVGVLNHVDDATKQQFEFESELFIDAKPAFYEFAGNRKRMTEAEFLASFSGGGSNEESQDEKSSSDTVDEK